MFIVSFLLPVERCLAQYEMLANNSVEHVNSYGINISGLTTASGLGLNLNPSFYYRHKKNMLAIGPNLQRDNMHLSGIQGYYEHLLNTSIKNFLLYYQLNLIYHHRANLGTISSDQYKNIYGTRNDFKFRTFEHYMGLGLKRNLSDHINFDGGLGIGAYYTLNAFEQPNKVPFKMDNDLSFMLKIGLTYDFKQ